MSASAVDASQIPRIKETLLELFHPTLIWRISPGWISLEQNSLAWTGWILPGWISQGQISLEQNSPAWTGWNSLGWISLEQNSPAWTGWISPGWISIEQNCSAWTGLISQGQRIGLFLILIRHLQNTL